MGLVLADEIGFECQRFCFGISDNEFNFGNEAHHLMNAGASVRAIEILANAGFKFFGFTDVENLVRGVSHVIYARLRWDLLEPTFEAIGILQQGQNWGGGDRGHGNAIGGNASNFSGEMGEVSCSASPMNIKSTPF